MFSELEFMDTSRARSMGFSEPESMDIPGARSMGFPGARIYGYVWS